MIDCDNPLFKPPHHTPSGIFTQVSALLLSQAAENRQQDLPGAIQGVDPFFFKNDPDILFFELPDILQAVNRVSGKPADRLGDNQINLPFMHCAIMLLKSSRFFTLVALFPSSAGVK